MPKRAPIEITIGDRNYSVPVMNLEQLEEYLEVGEKLAGVETLRAQLPILREQILVGLKGMDITDDMLRQDLDLEGLFELRDKMSQAAGLVKASVDPPKKPSDGTNSTPT